MNSNSLLHVVDDEKFIDAAHRICEAVAPGRHRFVMFADGGENKFIKSTPIERFPLRLLDSRPDIERLCQGHRIVVLHSLDERKLEFLRRLPPAVTVWWLGWGFDYYDLTNTDLLMPLTRAAMPPVPPAEPWMARLRTKLQLMLVPGRRRVDLLDRVDFFGPVIPEDHFLVKQALPRFKPQYLGWNYGTLEDDMIRGFEGHTVYGPNILVGNSATMTNNHLDAFELLRPLDLTGRRVIVPLSYGNPAYQRIVEKAGQQILGPAFWALCDFMPIDQYVATVASCSTVVMNHLRQQALGNIVIMLYLGAKVFLDRRNPLFGNLREQGAHVFSTEQIADEIAAPLGEAERSANRDLLRRSWSRDAVWRVAREAFDILDRHQRVPT